MKAFFASILVRAPDQRARAIYMTADDLANLMRTVTKGDYRRFWQERAEVPTSDGLLIQFDGWL